MRIVVLFCLIVLSIPISASAEASDVWRIAAHSLHHTNNKQAYQLAHEAVWWPGGPGHPISQDPRIEAVDEYYDFWHHTLDALPYIVEKDTHVDAFYKAFVVFKAVYVVINNKDARNEKYWLFYNLFRF